MSKVIPYSQLARQQQLNFLNHKGQEYREREEYLGSSRKLLFQMEAQMRLAEMQQLEVFREMAGHFKIPLAFPDLGDRLGLQQLFDSHPLLLALKEFFADRLSAEECYQKITALQEKSAAHPEE
ncbi:MAG TPA: hypothetical protein VIN67_07070 [Desulfobaccales bacterium]